MAETVSIDPSITNQQIRSWGAPSGLFGVPPVFKDPVFDELVFNLGLTRLRFEPPRREWEDPLNDDADPSHVTPGAFITRLTDDRSTNIFLPFKRRVEARGDRFEFYVSPSFFDGGSSGTAPTWLMNNPGEYCEWALTFLEHLRSQFGLVADYYSICNEAGNNNAFTASLVADLAKTLGPRLQAHGFKTRIQFPECVSADASWSYIQSCQADAELWRYVGLVSYHLYGGNNSRTNIRDFAFSRALPTAQTEYMGQSLNLLYDDLTLGGVSTWEFYALNDLLPMNSTLTWFSHSQVFWQTRQVHQFVRPGAWRIGATSSSSALRTLAFLQQGKTVLVLINTTDGAARSVDVNGLTPGVYGRSQTVGAGAAQELGLISVTDTALLTLAMPANAVLTLYPYAGSNLPPLITDWKATPNFLKQPSSTVSLSGTATDPEHDALSFNWSVLSAPPGAAPYLATSQSATCTVTGLVAAGVYSFQLTVRDQSHSVTRLLPVQVFAGNQAPELLDVHHRLPTTVILPKQSTTLRCSGRDFENDPLTYDWSLVSQPPGASAILLSPTNSACVATNLSVAGDYLFRIVLRDPTHAVSNDLPATVYAADPAPTISSATASPGSMSLPTSSSTLTALTTDPDGDPISHWWSVVSAPAGALPVFSSPGSNTTQVSGLILPGTYTFKITAVDRAGMATRTVNLSVAAGASPPLLFLASPHGNETYTSGQTIYLRWSSFQVNGPVKLEFYDGQSWSTITPGTTNDGFEPWTVPYGDFQNCRVRVSPAFAPSPSDESDQVFSIAAPAPRLTGMIVLPNHVPVLEIAPQPGLANFIERTVSLAAGAPWETVATLSDSSSSVSWTDLSATNLSSALYRVRAQ